MSFWDSRLGKAQAKFKSANPTEPKKLQEKPEYRIRSIESWDAIYARLQTARETFDSTKSGFWGRFKKGYRNLADKSGIAQHTLKLVPDLLIVSPVKSALEAAETASDAREKMTGTFNEDDLGKTFAKVELFLDIFSGDENITKACTKPVADILKAVEGTIVYFLSHTGERLFGSFQGKEDFQNELLDGITKIQAGTRDLIDEAQMFHIAVMQKTARAGSKLHDDIEEVGTMACKACFAIWDGPVHDRRLSPRNSFPGTLPSIYSPRTSSNSSRGTYPSRWHGYLRISRYHKMDIETIIKPGEAISLRYRSRANRIVKSDAFHAWARSARSCGLLIQGQAVADTVQAEAAMSLVSASIMQGLRGRTRLVPLLFFCGRHVEYDDEFTGGSAMIRSLTAQLLQQHFTNATFRKRDVHLEALEDADIDIVCGLFGWLIRHLPQNMTVICVLDDVSCYENRRYEADMWRVMEFLLGLARDESMPPAVKVLATCPTGTVDVHKLFKQGDSTILSMEGLPSMGEELGMLNVEDEL
ncbi:hypothetical protein DL768_002399 [Monosporascus sp. mg162]|nr:hypothetical protein DL768_002399 [Monosporascus sp. mg162]